MYFPICFLVPNSGPCVSQRQHLQVQAAQSTSTITQIVPSTTWEAAKISEESSASKYKAMLRSIYSSNSAASSRSAVLAARSKATASLAPTGDAGADAYAADDLDEEQLDESPLNPLTHAVMAAAGGIIALLI